MLQALASEKRLHLQTKQHGLSFLTVPDPESGITFSKELLYKIVNPKTVLFLSGGSTPKPLYELLAKEARIHPGAAALVDERQGKPMHADSNERMLFDTGLLGYFEKANIAWYRILKENADRVQITQDYDETVRFLTFQFAKSVALMGIGADGHTAGIAPNRQRFHNPLFDMRERERYVSSFADPIEMEKGGFGERITITFAGLSQMDCFLVLVFGENKKEALEKMLLDGLEEDIPARFYTRSDIAKKTVIITDQEVK